MSFAPPRCIILKTIIIINNNKLKASPASDPFILYNKNCIIVFHLIKKKKMNNKNLYNYNIYIYIYL